MASRYSDETNKELYRVVKSFNQRVRRHERKGEKNLPDLISVAKLKASFRTEKDLKNEIKQYKTILNNKQAFSRYKATEGSITNWEYDYIVKNLKATESQINREINRELERFKVQKERRAIIRDRLTTLKHEREIIGRDLTKLTASELKVISGTIDRFKHFNLRIQAGRRYFMKNLDYLLGAKGLPLSERTKIYNKLDKLSTEEFDAFYQNHDVVSEIMITIPSPDSASEKKKIAEKAMEDEHTSNIIDEFMSTLDENIKSVKEEVTSFNKNYKPTGSITTNKGEKLTYEEYLNKIFGDEF